MAQISSHIPIPIFERPRPRPALRYVNQELDRSDLPRLESMAETPADDSGPRRRVLVIASRFPPVASVGATRVRKFVKYLPQFGWDPVVLTGAQRAGRISAHDVRRAVDLESLNDIPETVPVHRLSAVLDNLPGHVSRRTAKLLGSLIGFTGMDEARWGAALKWRLQRAHDCLTFPDRGIWRWPAAVRDALRLHRQYDFDAIFSSGMPFSDHLIALTVSMLIRRPWLADFRDPWVEYVHWRQWQSSRGQLLTLACEAAVVHRAARVLSVNDSMTERFRARYPGLQKAKFVTLPNGFDPADFPKDRTFSEPNIFRLLHAGSLYAARSPQAVIEAFRRFIRETPDSADRARLDFAGRPGPFLTELSRPEDRGTIRYVGMLPHSKALEAMAAADVNLIILPDVPGSEGDSTAKMYECLGSGRMVLATVPLNGAAARELRNYEGVQICAPDDVESIRRAIGEMYQAWRTGTTRVARPAGQLATIDRRRQASKLAEILTSVAARRSAVHAGRTPEYRG